LEIEHGHCVSWIESRCPLQFSVFLLTGTFVITWGIVGSYALFPEAATAMFGAINGGSLRGAARLWHLPAFFLAGVVYEDWSLLPFFYR